MAMDRKNKKAAQVAAGNAGGGKEGGRGMKVQKREPKVAGGFESSPSTLASHARNPLLSGSTAPTRVLPTAPRRPLPMPLKAISPSAPAPPLKDTDFASFSLPDESDDHLETSAQDQPSFQTELTQTTLDFSESDMIVPVQENQPNLASSSLPLSTASVPRRLGGKLPGSPGAVDFGPIGSPPRSIGQQPRVNGASPGTSPSHNTGFVPTSPFSAPGTQTVFLSYEHGPSTDHKGRSGIAASLGANRTWMNELSPAPSKVTARPALVSGTEAAVDDEDLEDFLPSSLTDLLTVEERSRRMSRSNSGQPAMTINRDSSAQQSNNDGLHRYSRSVPATSLLSDIKHIWSDSSPGLPASPEMSATSAGLAFTNPGSRLGSGTPSSLKSNTGFGGRSFNEDTLASSAVPPSNASAAFLPGLHHHYLNSKAGFQHVNAGRGANSAVGMAPGALTTNPFAAAGSTSMAMSPPHMKTFSGRPPFEPVTVESIHGRPIPGNTVFGNDADERQDALSPSTRALQAHAPGQSLPQGLAAGYSRIHALPPPPTIPSPSASGTFSPGKVSTFSPGANGHDWAYTADSASGLMGVTSPNTGLESIFSPLSYATASRALNSHSIASPAVPGAAHPQASSGVAAPGMIRNFSGRGWPQSHGPFSPLSGPVLTGDDDDLFSMDG
jgi:hypothetical protein